jgi:hypothetical protein
MKAGHHETVIGTVTETVIETVIEMFECDFRHSAQNATQRLYLRKRTGRETVMSDEFDRYAVYWVPKRADALARFGVRWTGWCAEQGEFRPRSDFSRFSFDVAAVTRQLRRHGLHAVIKAPFRLGTGRSRFTLEHILGDLIENCVSFQLPRLHLAVVDGCVALVPRQNCSALSNMVARLGDAVAPLDATIPANGFAEAAAPPPGPEAIAIDDAESLVQMPASAAHRFHMPLTDQLGLELAFRVMGELRPLLEPMLEAPRRLDDIALMGDPGQGRPLRVLQRYDLSDTSLRKVSGAMPCHGPHVLVPMLDEGFVKSNVAI